MSIVANGLATNHAIELLKKEMVPTKHVSLHVNITEGAPVLKDTSKIESLLLLREGDVQEGTNRVVSREVPLFMGKKMFWSECEKGHIEADHVKLEVTAQLHWYRRIFSQRAVWADGHQHCHVAPGLSATFARIFRREGVRVTRVPLQESPASKKCSACDRARKLSVIAKRFFREEGVAFTTCFVGLNFCGGVYTTEEFVDAVILETKLASAREKTRSISCEVMVHPGVSGELDFDTKGKEDEDDVDAAAWDAFGKSLNRNTELAVLCDRNGIVPALQKAGINLSDGGFLWVKERI